MDQKWDEWKGGKEGKKEYDRASCVTSLASGDSQVNKMEDETNENAPKKEQVTSALPFSHNDRDVIERQLNVSSIRTSSLASVMDIYDIEKTVDIIVKYGYKNIALQFPDVLLPDSSSIAALLEQKTNTKVFILADTSYGSCCVDEVAAEHVKADVIIHYGRACLSLTRRLPVYYVFGKCSVNVTKCLQHFNDLIKDENSRVILMYDVAYAHCIEMLQEQLQSVYKNLLVSQLESKLLENVISLSQSKIENSEMESRSQKKNGNSIVHVEEEDLDGSELKKLHLGKDKDTQTMKRFGFEFSLPSGHQIEEYQIFYIGQQSLNLTNLMMTYNKCQFYTYDPAKDTSRKETLNVNRALMKRYYMIQKAKDAQVVGIAVGTLGVADYLEVIERLKKVLSHARKKYYTFVMGKLNVPKMANFMEIDVFVLVACPENSLIDSQEFYKPIVTPYEMEIACLRTQQWTGDYITDFRQLLPGASHSVDLEDKDNLDDDNVPDVSLISGDLRPNYKVINDDEESHSTSLVERNQETTLSTQRHTNAAEFLGKRSWRGLEQNLGETAVSEAKEGRMGIASGYTHEKDDS